MKLANLCADAVVRERSLDLVRNVTIGETKPVEKKRKQDYEDCDGRDDQARENRVSPREIAPALRDGRLLRRGLRWWLVWVSRLVYTHNTQPPCDSGNFKCL